MAAAQILREKIVLLTGRDLTNVATGQIGISVADFPKAALGLELSRADADWNALPAPAACWAIDNMMGSAKAILAEMFERVLRAGT